MLEKYPPEFKRDVITVARRGGLSVAGCARSRVWRTVVHDRAQGSPRQEAGPCGP